MTTWQPPHRISLPVAQQRWESVAFVHWRYEPSVIERLLPEELSVDTYDGAAWVGLTPFRMDAGMLPLLARPSVATGEVNVRTYVRAGGEQGLWFLSLEIDKPVIARSLRTLLQLPYRTASIGVERRDDRVTYRLRRGQDPVAARMELAVDVGESVVESDVTDLEVFLLARWRAFTKAYGRLVSVPVDHGAWPVRRATLRDLNGDLLETAAVPAPGDEPHVVFSDGVHARLGAPRRFVG